MTKITERAYSGILSTQDGACALASVLIMKLGGAVEITARDFALIHGTRFNEAFNPTTGTLTVNLSVPDEFKGTPQ